MIPILRFVFAIIITILNPPSQSLATWKTTINDEANSVNHSISANEIKYNSTYSPIIYSFPGLSKKDVYGNVYNNSATIPAWGSKILIPNGSAPLPISTGNIKTIMRFKN